MPPGPDTDEATLVCVEQIEKRNAVCSIFVRNKHIGTGFLVKVKGHLCVLTSNCILPDVQVSAEATLKFFVHGAAIVP